MTPVLDASVVIGELKSCLHHSQCPVRDVVPYDAVGNRRELRFLPKGVGNHNKLRRGVDQRAVEIKQYGPWTG